MHPNKNGGKPAAKLQVTTPTSSYPIYIGSGLLQRIGAYLGETPAISRIEEVLLVSNETVYPSTADRWNRHWSKAAEESTPL